ncbi:hypothetical protein TURU_002310 [Turdus rufiventris]|nr:hypothetical protein TURU_002310 [Turdus rufiventris]
MFVTHKRTSDSWRLLHDLRKINKVIEDMGPLQPGLPSVSMIPRIWPLVIIDVIDFNIPFHPEDAPRIVEGIMAEKGHNTLLDDNMHNPVYSWKNGELYLNGMYAEVQ